MSYDATLGARHLWNAHAYSTLAVWKRRSTLHTQVIREALEEDAGGRGDVTTLAT
jgi:hypothetical protein